jgi:nicotinate-nucleotide adenylyltransferase
MRPRTVGIVGGTFDPIHLGHLDAATVARDALGLGRVLLMPSNVPPHRPAPQASAYHRFAMVALAVGAHDALEASDVELLAPPPSYTSHTLDRLTTLGYEASDLFFITGADAFAEIATWYDYPGILDRCHFVVISRAGLAASSLPSRLPELARRMQVAVPHGAPTTVASTPAILLIDAATSSASSTEVRRRAGQGARLTGLVPHEVEAHIARHRLYT